MANQSAEDENSKNKSRGYLNSEAISNVASTLIWRSCTLPRPASWNIQSVEDQPPPIPSRNQRRTAPPLRPKSTSVLKHRSFLGMREPEIPRNIVFQCPICRTSVDSSKLQTNRYVIAHLKDLQRFKREHEPSSPVCRNAPLDQSREYVENAMIYIPENNWCNTCVKPCSADCSNHSYKPLHEYGKNVYSTLHSMVNNLEDRLAQHSDSLDKMDVAFKSVFQALTKASRHLWHINQSTQDMKEKVTTLRENINNKNPVTTPQEAIMYTAKIAEARQVGEELAVLENGTHSDEIFIWQQNNKLYVSTKEPDQTIIIT
ncbi:hypothetical protein SK128_002646, partial [Halocaridina rubra]